LALMSSEEMETLPFASFCDPAHPREQIYRPGGGFADITLGDYVCNYGLSYTAIWSIWTGHVFWRLGLVDLYWKRFMPRPPKPPRPEKWEKRRAAAVLTISPPV
jgi:hypothetical protein